MQVMIQDKEDFILVRSTDAIPSSLKNDIEDMIGVESIRHKRYSISIEFADFVISRVELKKNLKDMFLHHYGSEIVSVEIL